MIRIKIKDYSGYCLLIIGFVYLYYGLAYIISPRGPTVIPLAEVLGFLSLVGSIILLPLGVILTVLLRRETKARSIREKGYEYLEAFPFFCENCKKFTHTFLEYCEECNMKGYMRKSLYSDYEKYARKD